jgi:hypothetical protein
VTQTTGTQCCTACGAELGGSRHWIDGLGPLCRRCAGVVVVHECPVCKGTGRVRDALPGEMVDV